MVKLLVCSDDGVPSGYGRIAMEINTRLKRRGYDITAASYRYDGKLPAQYEGAPLEYWVAALKPGANDPHGVGEILPLIGAVQPDIIMVIQDAPFAFSLRHAPIDWSQHGFIVVTPVDGAPIYAPWIDMLANADGVLTISQFGVDAMKAQGVAAKLCRPAADVNKFYPLNSERKQAARAKLGIAPDAFVLGTVAMNQGRKCITHMLEAFYTFAADKPTARYLLNMDKVSPAGWDIPVLCQMRGWDASKLVWKEDCERAGVDMNERYNIMDAHAVVSHREGFGLPLVEAQAAGVVSIALDYCSGPEVCGDGRGVLVNKIGYQTVSTWGNALDEHPDVAHMVSELQRLYDNPAERVMIAQRGMTWARSQSWDMAADNVAAVIEDVMRKRRSIPAAHTPLHAPQAPQIAPSVDGIQLVEQGA